MLIKHEEKLKIKEEEFMHLDDRFFKEKRMVKKQWRKTKRRTYASRRIFFEEIDENDDNPSANAYTTYNNDDINQDGEKESKN